MFQLNLAYNNSPANLGAKLHEDDEMGDTDRILGLVNEADTKAPLVERLVMCNSRSTTIVPHPPWATHAIGGFADSDECVEHAEINSPGKNYGVSWLLKLDGSLEWHWFYPEYEHQANAST